MRKALSAALSTLRYYIPHSQLKTLKSNLKGEEGAYFEELLTSLLITVETMPVTYQTDGRGMDSIVYLHYFSHNMDWYITERDMVGHDAQLQAFGYVAPFTYPDCGELGYINLQDLTGSSTIELDLHFTPKPLKELIAKRN